MMIIRPVQRGFTLIELIITVTVIGILSVAMAPVYTSLVSSQNKVYAEKHKFNNQAIGAAFLSFAENATASGSLPPPYTGSGYTSTVNNPADATQAGLALSQALAQSGIMPVEIKDDGTTNAAVRVYQSVTGLAQNVPMYFQSGPLVTLTYQYGAIYLTACSKATAICNPTPATGIPGSSVALTSGNYSTWTTTGTDLPPYFISTLPLQKNMLVTTVQRLDKVRDALLGYVRAEQITAMAGDGTNWYPPDSTVASKNGMNPLAAGSQGCRDGWYSLSSGDVLATANLSSTEFGRTAWGGNVEYCRDYDPTGAGTPDASPHGGALRINKNVTSGIAPDAAVTGNNVVLTF